jgi:hypothetical protein
MRRLCGDGSQTNSFRLNFGILEKDTSRSFQYIRSHSVTFLALATVVLWCTSYSPFTILSVGWSTHSFLLSRAVAICCNQSFCRPVWLWFCSFPTRVAPSSLGRAREPRWQWPRHPHQADRRRMEGPCSEQVLKPDLNSFSYL